MTREEYLKELNKAFGDFKFFEEDHHYEYKGERIKTSVTRLIEEYTQPFDADLIAERVAFKQEKTKQEVLDEWQYKNDFSCHKGSACHNFVQCLWSQENYKQDNFDNSKEYLEAVEKIKLQAIKFKMDYQDKLEHLADEFVIGSEDYLIASAIDHLFIDKETGGLVLVDYKTNSDIHKGDKYAKFMQAPLQHLKDSTINHYFLQLSIYKYLVEKYTNLTIETMFIVYMSENLDIYEIIDVEYLEKEAEEVLEWNIWN